MADNKALGKAKDAKKDEFYTQLPDIEAELKHYRAFFKGKTVFCNCDDPYESNFFKYFALHFNDLSLKKLIATSYGGSPVAGNEFDMFEDQGQEQYISNARAYKVVMTELKDVTGDGAEDLKDVRELIKHRIRYLNGDGDFRSPESIELLKEADVVVTNPPFSLFREYVAQLMEYKKHFLIIGNVNAITYKEIFPFLKNNQIWLGASIHSGDRAFYVPDNYSLDAAGCGIEPKTGRKFIRVKGVRWFTNIDYEEHHEELILYKHYSPEEYPKYDNYDAIEVSKTADIPMDYDGVMGVPITFLDKYSPEQFEIIGLLQSSTDEQAGIPNLRFYNEFREMKQDMTFTGASGGKANGNPVLKGKSRKGNFLFNEKTKEFVHSAYARIVIRRKK